jgi:hypothetical protein
MAMPAVVVVFPIKTDGHADVNDRPRRLLFAL